MNPPNAPVDASGISQKQHWHDTLENIQKPGAEVSG